MVQGGATEKFTLQSYEHLEYACYSDNVLNFCHKSASNSYRKPTVGNNQFYIEKLWIYDSFLILF